MKTLPIFPLLLLLVPADAFIWLPFANLGSMFETLKQTALNRTPEFGEPDSAYSLLEIGKEFFNGIGSFLTSSFGDEDKINLASNLREIFNLTKPETTPKRIRPKLIPVERPSTSKPVTQKYIFPYTTPYYFTTTTKPYSVIPITYDPKPSFRFTTTTEPAIVKFVKTPKPSTTTPQDLDIIHFTTERTKYATFAPNTPIQIQTTTESTTTTTTMPRTTTSTTTTTTPSPLSPTTTTPPTTTQIKTSYHIWPTTSRIITSTEPTTSSSFIIRASNLWKKVTPEVNPELIQTEVWTTPMTPVTENQESTPSAMVNPSFSVPSSTAGIPHILMARKYTRPPINEKISVTSSPNNNQYDYCDANQKCVIKLKSFETSNPLFQYCYSHSTMIDDSIQDLLRETQTATFPVHISWRNSVTPEVVQLVQTLMALYRPSRCLVIGVFTGLGLVGIAERVDSRGIVVALEHPAYAVFWEKVGHKHGRKLSTAQMSRIQIRTSEGIEKSLPRLAANEPNTFDFIFLDDFKRENYLDDYEHAIRLLRSGGLLVINQALSGGGVLSSQDQMSNDDRVIRNMNIRIKQDARVTASLLPYGGGTWIITKN